MAIRNRAATEQKIIDAFNECLLKCGIEGIGVNCVLRQAGVGKELLYRYFGDLQGLARAWAQNSDFWPSLKELMGMERDQFLRLNPKERVFTVTRNFLRALRHRPLTQQVICASLLSDHELADVMHEIRETKSLDVIALFPDTRKEGRDDRLAVAAILVAAINYMVLFSRKRSRYYVFNFEDEASWTTLERSLKQIIDAIWSEA